MATSGLSASSPKGQILTCAVCLGYFTDPKFLPCFHTFCAKCIEDVSDRHPRTSFPCSSCRKSTTLPAGGVAALQSNFYIDIEELRSVRERKLCPIHDGKELDLFCFNCDKTVCVKCMFSGHKKHNIVDQHTAANKAKTGLSKRKTRLETAISEMTLRVERTKGELQAVEDKKTAVEKNILDRHALLVAASNKFAGDALASLHSVSAELETKLDMDLSEQEETLRELLNIQQELRQAFDGGTDNDVLVTAKKLRCGSSLSRSKTMLKHREGVFRPILRFNVTTDVILQNVQDYLGTVKKTEVEDGVLEMTVVERFMCGDETDIEVFSLCPLDEDPPVVWISYDLCGQKKDAPQKKFSNKGKLLGTSKITDRVTRKRYEKGRSMYPTPNADYFTTFSKSQNGTHFELKNDFKENAIILDLKVTSTDPFKTEIKTEFSIKVGAHRALDVDDSEQFFAIVEEAQLPDTSRKVRLYRRPEENPISTYSPPTSSFQPSDVCFYKLGGQQVLLVTDELNDAIHVVQVQNGQMNFVRYLAPGCPLLIQPTAINVDVSGHLWLACRGGNIISMEPKVTDYKEEEEKEEEEEEEKEEEEDQMELNLLNLLREL